MYKENYSNTFRFDVNGSTVKIHNYYIDRGYNGFAHRSELWIDNAFCCEYKQNYTNRTWEYYDYQTSATAAAEIELKYWMDRKQRIFMAENGYTRMTAKRRKEFDGYLKNNPSKPVEILESVRAELQGTNNRNFTITVLEVRA